MAAHLTRVDAESAAQHLGIEINIDAVTTAEVRAAYAAKLFNAHPDTSEKLPSHVVDAVADTIATLRAARDMMMEWISGRPNPDCPLCKGTGHYRTALSSRPCPRCT